ncbi:MAG: geranylgeranylglyceryl/heptaprenylglyceryl phosphate synthase [Bacteroidetes bacterium]|nr:geranylgeranylglyceryl/heptaprenylglyceryl phosphate synthase [Bacteroidota bacterium]
MTGPVYKRFVSLRQEKRKAFAVLIDPDKVSVSQISSLAERCNQAGVDFVFMGGSLMVSQHLDECIQHFKASSDIPVVLFPGSPSQVSSYADALFYLSLISGRNTYMSGSAPIPRDKDDIALCTALAGEMQGKHLLYVDAGSGARLPVSDSMIQKISAHTQIPLIVGGGIKDPERAYLHCKSGADVVVVGNAIEKDANLIQEIASAVHQQYIKA